MLSDRRRAKKNKSTNKPHKHQVYKMESNPRGLCIIINNIEFQGNLSRRVGAEVDASKMKDLFEKKFHFKVVQLQNTTTGGQCRSAAIVRAH
ncbi:hypothetical protein HPB48_015055 [Haemaphysalis longicornis]|uniref:Caspase family p20 domain-containing protein n=1 Tax=Haemaphysalis longicornis TaxID=44386 RepID=A0A9J6GSZ0_HAELO|nr:hypothetical protein HPB48_015055 [Haemaphysalis longicornis]